MCVCESTSEFVRESISTVLRESVCRRMYICTFSSVSVKPPHNECKSSVYIYTQSLSFFDLRLCVSAHFIQKAIISTRHNHNSGHTTRHNTTCADTEREREREREKGRERERERERESNHGNTT